MRRNCYEMRSATRRPGRSRRRSATKLRHGRVHVRDEGKGSTPKSTDSCFTIAEGRYVARDRPNAHRNVRCRTLVGLARRFGTPFGGTPPPAIGTRSFGHPGPHKPRRSQTVKRTSARLAPQASEVWPALSTSSLPVHTRGPATPGNAVRRRGSLPSPVSRSIR